MPGRPRRQWMHRSGPIFVSLVTALLAGCAAGPDNPSFPVTSAQAKQSIQAMRRDRKPLPRPLVVVGGFFDPNISTPFIARFFAGVTRDTRVVAVPLGWCGSFEQCRDEIIAAVDKACPSSDPQWTTEVDVVGLSLGGLAARYAACPERSRAESSRDLAQ